MLRRRTVLSIILSVLFLESASYYVWKAFEVSERLNYYSAMKKLVYVYHKKYRVVMPLPNQNVVTYSPEFADTFPTHDINNLGIGFFDDGLDKTHPKVALAIGDSMTRGVGSLNNLQNGWAELTERKLVDTLDIINLGNSGTGQPQQFLFFDRLVDFLPHDLVILNFYSGGDFLDNTLSFDFNIFLSELPATVDPSKIYNGVQQSFLYDPSYELLLKPVHSYMLCLLVRSLSRIFPNLFLPHVVQETRQAHSETANRSNHHPVSLLKEIGERNIDSWQRIKVDKFYYLLTRYHYVEHRDEADLLINHSASLINTFYQRIKDRNIPLVIVIHPAKEEIYLDATKIDSKDIDVNYPREQLVSLLNPEIPILILAPLLKKMAQTSQENLYWPVDPHYTPAGHKAVSEHIAVFLEKVMRHEHPPERHAVH